MKWLEKSRPPKIAPTIGMMMSSVRLVDDLGEGGADDHGDGEVEHIALGDEGAEFLQHVDLPSCVAWPTRSVRCAEIESCAVLPT